MLIRERTTVCGPHTEERRTNYSQYFLKKHIFKNKIRPKSKIAIHSYLSTIICIYTNTEICAIGMKVKVHSGLQLQVLALYKKALQAAARKDSDTLHYVRERFRENVRHLAAAATAIFSNILLV